MQAVNCDHSFIFDVNISYEISVTCARGMAQQLEKSIHFGQKLCFHLHPSLPKSQNPNPLLLQGILSYPSRYPDCPAGWDAARLDSWQHVAFRAQQQAGAASRPGIINLRLQVGLAVSSDSACN